MAENKRKKDFLEKTLPKLILARNEDLKDQQVVKCDAKPSCGLDGFMSEIYIMDLWLKNNGVEKLHQMIVKVMKGDVAFREHSKSEVQCSNEVYIYKTVIPYFKKYLGDSVTSFDTDDWIPRVYFSDKGIYPELSDDEETILAMENLKPLGYRLGPRIDLDEKHLRLMIKNIAQYHSVTYALRINGEKKLQELIDGLKPLRFLNDEGEVLESYNILFKISLARLFAYVEETPKHRKNPKFLKDVENLKIKYGDEPIRLMETFLQTDDVFSVILHGDYNRNNVLFKYETEEGFENPLSLKMIDFQEIRYATPTIDLAFFMYMNMHGTLRPSLWDNLLEFYHETVINSLTDILKCEKDDPRLEPYSKDHFLAHFKKFAFYGAVICVHFIPWMACPEEECSQLAEHFEKDMHNPEFEKLAMICGGEDVSERITGVVKHASEKGYMEILE